MADDPPFFPVVDIAAADAGVVYGDEDVVGGLDRWLGSLLECDIVRFVENEREVLIVPVSYHLLRHWRGKYAFCLCHIVSCIFDEVFE